MPIYNKLPISGIIYIYIPTTTGKQTPVTHNLYSNPGEKQLEKNPTLGVVGSAITSYPAAINKHGMP